MKINFRLFIYSLLFHLIFSIVHMNYAQDIITIKLYFSHILWHYAIEHKCIMSMAWTANEKWNEKESCRRPHMSVLLTQTGQTERDRECSHVEMKAITSESNMDGAVAKHILTARASRLEDDYEGIGCCANQNWMWTHFRQEMNTTNSLQWTRLMAQITLAMRKHSRHTFFECNR